MGTGLRRIEARTRGVQTTKAYRICDAETDAYYGFMDYRGNWMIIEEDSGAYRYAFGDSDYSTNWTGRTELTYTYFDGS